MFSRVLTISIIISWVSSCISHSALRVIGGKDADEDKYQFVVRLEKQIKVFAISINVHICTGALITPIWTVTAAHCVVNTHTTKFISKTYYIRIGTVDDVWLKIRDSLRGVLKSITHPRYILNAFGLRNDIALVKSTAVNLTHYARVSALDHMTLIGLEATVTGYGITNVSVDVDDATTLQKPLQMLDVIVVKCLEEKSMEVSPRLCVARRCGRSAGLCPGDSGGPLLHSSGILGLNSYGPKNLKTFCALKSTRPVYDVGVMTPINPFIDWIRSTIEQDSLSPDSVIK